MYTLRQLADHVEGRVVGDETLRIRDVRPFELAGPGDLTLAVGRKYLQRLEATRASAAIVPPGVRAEGLALLEASQPKVAFARLLQLIHARPFVAKGVSPLAVVGSGCHLTENVTVHPHVTIGEGSRIGERVTLHPGVAVGSRCVIGDDCVLYPNVVLYDGVRLGARVLLHAGTVVGADGFGYAFDGERQWKIPQTGGVVLEDDVEVGANCCIDRATFGETVIERGVKLDNHVHVGHNCRIGEHSVLVAQVGLSGSVQVGRNTVWAGHSGAVDHVRVGDSVTVLAKTAVTKDVPTGSVVSGSPAMDHRRAARIQAVQRRLPEWYREWREWKAGNSRKER